MTANLRLQMVFYGSHSPERDARIKAIRPRFIIANTPHGLWGEVNGNHSPALLHDNAGYRKEGIRVIGYLTSGYEGVQSATLGREWYSLDTNMRLIRNMALIDGVDGVFIDECSDYPGPLSKEYLTKLTGLCRSLGLTTWGNVGVDHFDPWFFADGGFDFMHSSEVWHGQALSPVQRKWGNRISVTGFRPEYTVRDAIKLTRDAWRKGIAYCYINSADYVSLPPWLEEYAAALARGS